EGAGFRNAIVVRQAPDPSEDPDFSPEDIRYSMIRWLPSATQNAFGPNVHDPRTGEILNGDIEFYHNMKASSLYPQEKVRDKEWVHKMGFTPSIMDYVRFNYVAQPEDGIAPEDL